MADFSSVGGTQVYGPPDVTKISNFSDAGGYGVDAYNQALRDIPKPQVIGPKEEYYATHTDETPEPDVQPGDITNIAKGAAKAVANQALDLGKVSVPSALRYPTTLEKSPQEQAAFDKARLAYLPRGTAQQVGSTTVNAASTTLPIADVPNLVAHIPSMVSTAYDFAKEALGANPEALDALVKAADAGKAYEPAVQSEKSQEMLAGLNRAVGNHPAFNPELAERTRFSGQQIPTDRTPVFPLERPNLLGTPDETLADVDFIANAKRHGVDEETIDSLLNERRIQREDIADARRQTAEKHMDEAYQEDAQRSMEPALSENVARQQKAWEQAGQQAATQQAARVENAKIEAELASTPNVPTFYSKAENVATAKLPGSGNGDAMLATLKNNGVKPDEMDWMDLEDFLKGKKKVTKQEVLDYIRNNGINLKETTLTDTPKAEQEGTLVRHHRYVLDGPHTNYQEKLFTLVPPAGGPEATAARQAASGRVKELNDQIDAIQDSINQLEDDMRKKRDDPSYQAKQYLSDEEHRHNLYESQTKMRHELHEQERIANPDPMYQAPSAHFSGQQGKNLLAHARYNDRILANGDKALHLEEIQSDWHQAGRESGYSVRDKAAAEKKLEDAQANLKATQTKWDDFRTRPENKSILEGNIHNISEYQAYLEASKAEEAARAEYGKAFQGVSDAPLKHNWQEMVLKRMIRQAAENGYDRLSWTTGEQQARRWSALLENVGRIEFDPKGGEVYVYDVNGRKIGSESAETKEELARVVGEHMAEDLWKQGESYEGEGGSREPNPEGLPTYDDVARQAYDEARQEYSIEEEEDEDGEPTGTYKITDSNGDVVRHRQTRLQGLTQSQAEDKLDTLVDNYAQGTIENSEWYDPESESEEESDLPSVEGDGITIGAHGHSGFYDKMIGDFMRKYVKKWGSTVEDIPLKDPDNEGNTQVVHTIKITPKMKKSVLKEGQPIAQNKQQQGPAPAQPVSPYQYAQQALG